jgi:hypothetical protein
MTMGILQETSLQLITAAIAFVLGVLLNRALKAWAYLRARKFWRPIIRRDLALVLGDGFQDLPLFEASQLVGQGDLVASFELNAHFSAMGIRQLRPISADKASGVDPTGRGRHRNFIVIGGQDANTLTDQCLERFRCSYKLTWPTSIANSNAVADAVGGQPAAPDAHHSEIQRDSIWHLPRLIPATHREKEGLDTYEPVAKNEQIVKDYGIIIRARNPFLPEGNSSKRIVLIYGCYGFGSTAAVLFSMEKAFLKRVTDTKKDIECIVTCDVIDKTPQAIHCVYFQEYSPGNLLTSSSVQSSKPSTT